MSLLPFIAVAILVIITPGPDMAIVTRNALSGGHRAALLTALGIMVGLLAWTAASVIGLLALQSLVLAGVFAGLGLVWLVTYALVASAAAVWLRRPGIKRALTAVTGVVLVGLGLRLATESR